MLPGGIRSSHYLGMTATSLHNRMLSHLQDQRSKNSKSVMNLHDINCYEGVEQQYTMDIVTSERRLLLLCMREALLIEGQDPGLSINDKMEQGRGSCTDSRCRHNCYCSCNHYQLSFYFSHSLFFHSLGSHCHHCRHHC